MFGLDETGVSGKRLVFDGWNCQFNWNWRLPVVGARWGRIGNCWDVWLYLLPCLALHVSWWYHDPGQ